MDEGRIIHDAEFLKATGCTLFGDIITVVMQGDFGKLRPALIVQSDQFNFIATLTVLPISSTLINAPLIRLTVPPNSDNGLRKPSQILIDKAMTLKREKFGKTFGRLDDETMVSVNRALALLLGFA